MAAGFSVKDALNKNSKATFEETPRARFRTKDISIFKMYRNDMNFYDVSQIKELADEILVYGLKQNLEVIYSPCEKGEYKLVSGERRWEALKYLVGQGYKEFELATTKLTAPQDADEEQIEIIIANAYRLKSNKDLLEEEKRLKESLERMRASGKKIKGYDLQTGRLRDVIAAMLNLSKTKIAQIEAVNNHLLPGWQEELKKDNVTFSAAYELSKLSAEQQENMLNKKDSITHKDIKKMQKEEKKVVSESDTETYKSETQQEEPKQSQEMFVSESDTQTYKSEIQQEEPKQSKKMFVSESDTEECTRYVHISIKEFNNINARKQNFLIKKDTGYREDNIVGIIEITEEGRRTGRNLKVWVTHVARDCQGLEKGYCVLGFTII